MLTTSTHAGFEKHLDNLVKKGEIDEVNRLKVKNEIRRMADGGNNPSFTVISKKVQKYWANYLTKKGVKFEIGTSKANKILDENYADGMFRRTGYDWKTNRYKEMIIYLKKEPSTSAFLEETYHALQCLEGVQEYRNIIYKGIKYENVDNWEFLAKKRILDEAEKNGINYEEYILVEKQLQEVLNGIY